MSGFQPSSSRASDDFDFARLRAALAEDGSAEAGSAEAGSAQDGGAEAGAGDDAAVDRPAGDVHAEDMPAEDMPAEDMPAEDMPVEAPAEDIVAEHAQHISGQDAAAGAAPELMSLGGQAAVVVEALAPSPPDSPSAPDLAAMEAGAMLTAPTETAPTETAPTETAPTETAPTETAPTETEESASAPAPATYVPETAEVPPDDTTAPAPAGAEPVLGAAVDLALQGGGVGRRPLPRVMAIANQKGGVGKTTTAVNLGAGLAELGYRVLVVDLDPQGNATTGLGVNARNLQSSIYDVLLGDLPLEDCIEATAVRNLFLAPATIDLAGAEIELVPAFSRELKLRRALERGAGEFDFTVIDCPPSLGLLTVNGLAAAGEVVVPIQCEYYALEGLGQLLKNVQLVQTNLNPRLELSTIVLTMYDARTKLADQVAREVRTHFGPKVCRNIVPRTVRLSEAPSFGQPIIVFDPSSRGALAYRELAKEVSGGPPQRTG